MYSGGTSRVCHELLEIRILAETGREVVTFESVV